MKRISTLLAGLALSMLIPAYASAQSGYEVKGVIVDEIGPVVGATVMEPGTSTGTVSDLDGHSCSLFCRRHGRGQLHRLCDPDLQGLGDARHDHPL